MQNILEILSISKSYGNIQALSKVSFSVRKGSVFGILGPNGSGKTTLLGILLNILKADAGSFSWNGFDNNDQARKKIGSLLETPNFYPYLNAVENLQIVAEIKECSPQNIDFALKKTGLFERRLSNFKTYSLGMKQRLAIASTLLAGEDILVFDEPTNGLDPQGIAEIRELILQLHREGKTIILASHLLDEVEKVCTDMAIIKKGELLSVGSTQELLSDEEWFEISSENNEALVELLHNHSSISIQKIDQHIFITLADGFSIEDLNRYCFSNQIALNYILKRKQSLESKFIEIIN